jgi:hypothetical protein
MKAGPPHNFPQDKRWDEKDPLWRLLGEARRPEPSAWFTTTTLARCHHEAHVEKEGWLPHGVTVQIWRWAFAGALATCGIVAFMTHLITLNAETATSQKNVQDAFEVMAAMNTDPDSSPSSSWQDSSQ